ncbi:uncharacterized protein LOC134260873 [Saccostrea cucullata]|uniref:uncharacterized protein LOC134258257 n=1 Tax=Saccostrea cuccullata TaxID=36930 RepID=UPI002ED687A6
MSSSSFNTLTFSDSDYTYQYLGPSIQGVSVHQGNQPVQKCTFQCVCCARLSMGTVCSCNQPKSNASTQTNNFEFPQETLDADNMWKKGTFEHGVVQRLINATLERLLPTSGKYTTSFSSVLDEVKVIISQKFPNYTVDCQKLKRRIQKAMQWQRYYAKKREEAQKNHESAWKLMKRKRQHSNKENVLLLQDTEEIGVDNRGFEPDSDSDSDIPLAKLTKKKSL